MLRTILDALKINGLPVRLSQFTPSSLSRLFPSSGSLRPSVLVTSLFPHLRHDAPMISFSSPSLIFFSFPRHASSLPITGLADRLLRTFSDWARWSLAALSLPFELTQQECRLKRKELESIRDERAKILGRLAQQRGQLANALKQEHIDVRRRMFYQHLGPFTLTLKHIVNGEPSQEKPPLQPISLADAIGDIGSVALPESSAKHAAQLEQLRRPPRLVLLWPKLLLLPPLTLYALRSLYVSRDSLLEMAQETTDTVKGFLVYWLIEPLREVLKTVRTRGEDGVIVRKEGVMADMEVDIFFRLEVSYD